MKLLGAIILSLVLWAAPALAANPETVKLCYPVSPTSCIPVDSTHGLPINGSITSSPYQFTAAGAMQSGLSVTTGAAVSLTPPAGSLAARICARGAIIFTDDGTTNPTTGTGGVGT